MYLHLGQDTIVKTDDIIGIFDIENTTTDRITREYLAEAEKKGNVVNVSLELPKSFVVCSDGKETKVYISQISTATLLKRSRTEFTINT